MSKIKFLEESHQYFDEERELISVSKFVKGFEQDKDWTAIAAKYAKKNGHTAEYWQAVWKDKGLRSSEVGTIFHSIREQELLDQDKPEFFGVTCEKLECEHIEGIKWGIPIEKLPYNTVFPELIIYDTDFGICGQSDKVIITNDSIHVMDYKTDKEIAFKGYSSQWKSAEKLKAPLSHLDNCNGNLYSLKMSLYMYMLWKKNKHLKPGKLIIEHIELKRDDEGIPILLDGKPVVLSEKQIELPYRKTEVIDMLNYYKNNT